jgi:hypothetical protein
MWLRNDTCSSKACIGDGTPELQQVRFRASSGVDEAFEMALRAAGLAQTYNPSNAVS